MSASNDFVVSSISEEKYCRYLAEKIQEIANEAISSRGVFILGVSGGSVVDVLSAGLPLVQTDWTCWKIILCDERLVPEDDPESTFGLYKNKLLPIIPGFLESNFIQADSSLEPEQAAKDYESKLKQLWTEDDSTPSYGMADCLILGVGPDGHTCSLFPNHQALNESKSWVTFVTDSPKPPPKRITLTFSFINKATNIFVSGKGQAKWDILERVKSGEDLPIGRVSNPGGHLEWALVTPK